MKKAVGKTSKDLAKKGAKRAPKEKAPVQRAKKKPQDRAIGIVESKGVFAIREKREITAVPRTVDRIALVENSYHPKNSEFISKLFQSRASQIHCLVIDIEFAAEKIREFAPEVILIDVDSMRHRDALEFAHQIQPAVVGATIIFLSDRKNPIYIKEGMAAAIWARAYWLNQPSLKPEMVVPEILRAFKGQKQLNPAVLESANFQARHIGLLSPQQHRVMQAMSRGASNAKIAKDCHLTTKAVERTIAAASKLLGVSSASEDVNSRVMASNIYRSGMDFHDLRQVGPPPG